LGQLTPEQVVLAAAFQFLLELHKVVPASCKPILVTDAGFHAAKALDDASHVD
jgi:hypothetical protein